MIAWIIAAVWVIISTRLRSNRSAMAPPTAPTNKPRQRVKKSDDADSDGRIRDVPHQPTLRDVLHEIAGAGDQCAFQQEAEISMSEGTEGAKIP